MGSILSSETLGHVAEAVPMGRAPRSLAPISTTDSSCAKHMMLRPDPQMEALSGTIAAFSGADGLGDIALEDGRTVRFSLRACGPIKPELGLKVMVQDLAPGFGGKLRAGRVRPTTARPVESIRVWPEPWTDFEEGAHWQPSDRKFIRFDPELFFAQHPEWVNKESLRDLLFTVHRDAPPPSVEPAPMFAPWSLQVEDSSAVALRLGFVPISVPDGGPSRVFAKSALIEGEWPLCLTCRDPLELVLYLHGLDFAFIGNEDSYFAAFLCTSCCNELALGDAPWRFEHGVAQHRRSLPPRTRSPKLEMPAERAIEPTASLSYPDPRTLAVLSGAASSVLAVVVRKERQPDPRFPLARTEDRPLASVLYREWLQITGERSQLGGFLNWRHDLDGEHPKCVGCGTAMRLLGAISEEDSGMPLGDDVGGTLYLFFCNRNETCGSYRDIRVIHQFM